jgi:hypothetical protein
MVSMKNTKELRKLSNEELITLIEELTVSNEKLILLVRALEKEIEALKADNACLKKFRLSLQ